MNIPLIPTHSKITGTGRRAQGMASRSCVHLLLALAAGGAKVIVMVHGEMVLVGRDVILGQSAAVKE